MNITIKIDTGNAAFEDMAGSEVARILRKLADRLDEGTIPSTIRLLDINGNTVGRFTAEEDA